MRQHRVDAIITGANSGCGGKVPKAPQSARMREFEADLEHIARVSKMLAFGFWFGALAAAAGLAYVLVVWMPRHHLF